MNGSPQIKVTVVPQTEQIATALEIMARHALACAEELRAAQLSPVGYLFTAPTDEAT